MAQHIVAIADIHLGSKPPPTYKYDQAKWDADLVQCIHKAAKVADELENGAFIIVGDIFDRESVSWRAVHQLINVRRMHDIATWWSAIPGPGHDMKTTDVESSVLFFAGEQTAIDVFWGNFTNFEVGRNSALVYTPPPMTRVPFMEWLREGNLVKEGMDADVVLLHGPVTLGARFPHITPKEISLPPSVKLVLCGDIHPPFMEECTFNSIGGSCTWASPGSIVAKNISECEHEASMIIAKFDPDLVKVVDVPLTSNRRELFIQPAKIEDSPIASSQLAQALGEGGLPRANAVDMVYDLAKAEKFNDEQIGYIRELLEGA